MKQITKKDLVLVNDLSKRTYSNNKLLSNASIIEKEHLGTVKSKLREIATYFANKYSDSYGPFKKSVVTGNDIAIGGNRFKRIWSGFYKGGDNKQYSPFSSTFSYCIFIFKQFPNMP